VNLSRVVFSLATFFGSTLLFLIQPMAAKMILPIFGGSPAVWTASMLFFQVALLGGYWYAHFSNSKWGPNRQKVFHVAFLVLTAIALPQLTKTSFVISLAGGLVNHPIPAVAVFLILGGTIGLGYLTVSSGSPVLQRWFATTSDPSAKDPYFLYAISNVGSMLGLFLYPFVIEPRIGLNQQISLWQTGFQIMVGLYLLSAFFVKKPAQNLESEQVQPDSTQTSISWDQRRRWMLWAAVPTSMLLGATSYISSNVAPIPLIWVVPLATYLLTFILAFSGKPLFKSTELGRMLPILVIPLAFTMCIEATEPLTMIAGFHLLVLLVAAYMCHAKLAEDRPSANHLTEFYLWISVGGALGGLFNSILAPMLFPTYFEYPLAIGLACLLRPQPKPLAKTKEWLAGVILLVAIVMLAFKFSGLPIGQLRNGLAIGIPLAIVFVGIDRTLVFGMGLIATFLFSNIFQIASPGKVLLTKRSFFGVHRVLDNKNFRGLVHGNTTHGRQSLIPSKVDTPLTYYYPTGPIGQIFTKAKFMPGVKRVGLVGLGVGSLAAYGRPGQDFTFFEIDPIVISVARDSGLYSFLSRSKANVNYVLGDARITLGRQPNASFDFLVLDAFSSDAIPTHLLTKEALQLYKSKLKPGGFIAFHISNRYLELAPELALTASEVGMTGFEQTDAPVNEEEAEGKTQSKWMILLTDPGLREAFWKPMYWNSVDIPSDLKPWTDDFVNILSVFEPSN
jgi:SAM-dependent methyltransferase